MTRRSQRGFTLMELIVAMTIMALLASVGIVGFRHHTKVSREAVLKEDLFQLNHAVEQFRADKGKAPKGIADLQQQGYLRAIPVDPMTNSKDTWYYEMEDANPDDPEAEVGIWRIRSGSTDIGDNGIPYNEWMF